MASSREYLDFILEQLSGLERIAYRAMMGEFILPIMSSTKFSRINTFSSESSPG